MPYLPFFFSVYMHVSVCLFLYVSCILCSSFMGQVAWINVMTMMMMTKVSQRQIRTNITQAVHFGHFTQQHHWYESVVFTTLFVAFRLPILCIFTKLEMQERYWPIITKCRNAVPCVPRHFNHWASPRSAESADVDKKGKGSPYSITERRVPELIPVLGSQPAGDVNHIPDGRLPLLSARPAVTPQPLRGLLPILLLGEQRDDGCEQFAYDCYPSPAR